MYQQTPRHKVFISFYNEDQYYKDVFAQMMEYDIVDKSVSDGDIDDLNIKTETIRQKIRDDFIADATVTVVLIGPGTWQRKHVDWEIGSSLRHTKRNSRCGLLGILLPNHPNYNDRQYKLRLIPPRIADNVLGDDPYAYVIDWQNNANTIREWIHRSFQRRYGTPPKNNRPQYGHNRPGPSSRGWTD